jgi:hypothetical protein
MSEVVLVVYGPNWEVSRKCEDLDTSRLSVQIVSEHSDILGNRNRDWASITADPEHVTERQAIEYAHRRRPKHWLEMSNRGERPNSMIEADDES